jgi:GT2 family glycosyltransferase
MKIFVIVVTYNGLIWVDRCFGSLRNAGENIKTIVIDNGSTDGTQDKIVKDYPEVHFVQSATNLGFSKANNLGISMAGEEDADYVFLLNQDAWVETNTIQRLVAVAQKHPEYGVLSPVHLDGTYKALDYGFSNYVTPEVCPDFYSDTYLHQLKELYEVKFVNAAAWLITKECIKKVGELETLFFFYGEDFNYLQRVRFHQLKIGVVPDCTICHNREDRKEKTTDAAFKIRERMKTLMVLLNIWHSFPRCILSFVKMRISAIIRLTYALEFKQIKYDLAEFIYLAGHFNKIKQARKKY